MTLDFARQTDRIPASRPRRPGPPARSGLVRRAYGIVAILAATLLGLVGARAQTPAAPLPGVDAALLEDIVVGSRILAELGVLDAFGHVSARHPTNPNRFIMSRSLAPALVTADDIMEFDLDGNPVDARGRAVFLERFIHSEIYKARPDVMSVVHTHSPGVIPFGVSRVPLRPMYHNPAFLGAGVPVFDIRTEFGETDMLVRNKVIGKALAQTLGDKPVALMRGHGDVAVGPSVHVAVFRAYYTDVNARLQAQAIALGGEVNYLTPEEAAKADAVNLQVLDRVWNLWKMHIVPQLAKGSDQR
ncbi:HCOMODA/2-hydroxy-3-carboxy-muconic semialdehyde decarboxylase [Rhizobiales bacterium GAS113]|nr:HCOMODA/2-hydroxy-3-carboxy-muconic semialdehyde decarboxylase [Rhizobiales bacterium GAS113]SED28398.1 HCOMODA/2-hydroxy-3-carboxy-muconic semialdehyde decarboxylase [Rhizobiales bacterium GAS188]